MTSRFYLLIFGCAIIGAASSAAISDNFVAETPRIASSEELISSIMNECFSDSTVMNCLKGKVLTYLDSVLGLNAEQARAFEEKNVDKVIVDRIARILSTNEFKVQLPETVFQNTVISYRADRGLDFEVPQEQARGHLLKKKLLLPILLLLKLKMKALMPIFVAIIGLKAMKALVLSKLAITLVLGFLIAQLVKKSGLGASMPMSMMPMSMTPADPMPAYGAPAPSATETPSTSYGPASWEPSSGAYSRIWDPSTSSSSHNLAYSSYYPSSGSSSSSSSLSSSSSSSASSPSSSTSAHAY